MPQPIKSAVTLEVVAEWFDISIKDILGYRRSRNIVNARSVVAFILRNNTSMSLLEIGTLINRDHSSVIHAVRRIKTLVDNEVSWRIDVDEMLSTVQTASFPEENA